MSSSWHCQRDGYTWPGCGACPGCRDAAPTVFANARQLADEAADHQLHHGQAIARLDAQRVEMGALQAELTRLRRGINIAVLEMDYAAPTLWEDS